MGEINMANRQCCDVDIRDYVTKKPLLFADFCNTTTAGFTGDAIYANKKGAKCIKFDNPLDGTISMEFQVHPFKIYSMLSDGVIETTAMVARRETVDCTEQGHLTLDGHCVEGSVFVYKFGDFGGEALEIEGNNNEISGDSIKSGYKYEVAYIQKKASGVKKISFNNKKLPKYYWAQMSTLDKDENGELVPVKLTCYKGAPIRNLELQFSSEGDPATIKIELECLEDENGDILDMIEITNEE